ncbi:lipopolysaccharide biosynthesis protein [Butyricimonas hominis]|uniref:Lipopolysaccharide biosynthesis protein n=1 Tax=Butyricimonas hominis TaxID=2763032 RepID=A0ABR7D1X0_9BACT|nr:lipopolysaccharide biosynthesis protein [Butyricimonas hominis]MBC5621933.1 lipopolysaccharide biosynthesis protein [Butyricimonas hominis]
MSNIKQQLASGVFYTAVAKYTGVLVSIVITGILSRLLTAEEYGTIIPVVVLINFFTIFGDIGIGPAIIQNKDLSGREINSLFSFTILMGIVLSGLFFCGSWLIARVYESDILVVLCQLLSISLFFSCANVVTNALLYKAKLFKYLAIRSLIAQVVAGLISIVAAYCGAGIYALVIQSILSCVFLFLVSYIKNPLKLCFKDFEWSALKKIRHFSSYQFLFDILNYFSVNLDKLLISRFIGASELGYYDKSYKLMQMPMQNIPFVITPVMHPIFCEMQDNLSKMCTYYTKVVRFLAFVGFPLSILLFFSGEELIYIIFGKQWTASIPAFKILVLSVGFQIILSTSGSIFQSAGVTKFLFLSGVLSTITIVIATMVGLLLFGSIEAISFFLVCAFIINFFQTYIIMYCILFRVGLIIFIKNLLSPLLLTLILGLVLFFVALLTVQFNDIVSLFIKGCVALLIAFIYIQFTGEYDIIQKMRELRCMFLKR